MKDSIPPRLDQLLIGNSSHMVRLRDDIRNIGPTHLRVLIQGEMGTGKELVAWALHLASGRGGAFCPTNVHTLPEALVESELFGHEKGAFTGADRDKVGLVGEADGGTIFLDEIDGLSKPAQGKLLRVSEYGEYRRLGGTALLRSDFRLISGTNRSLEQAVAARAFRDDLFYRINEVIIHTPALRHRTEDIPALVAHFIAVRGFRPFELAPDAIDALASHPWPGNVRELQSVIGRLSVFRQGDRAHAADIATAISMGRADAVVSRAMDKRLELAALLVELRRDTTKVATRLGVDRSTIYRWIKRYGLNA